MGRRSAGPGANETHSRKALGCRGKKVERTGAGLPETGITHVIGWMRRWGLYALVIKHKKVIE
jgi:hypothetical protein